MFKFSLEKLFGYRQRLKEEKQREFFRKENQLQDLENSLTQLRERRNSHQHELNQKMIQGMVIEELQHYQNFLTKLSSTIEENEMEKMLAVQQLEEKRLELIESEKEVKILEKLEEKEQKAYLREELRQERLLLDDLGVNGFTRRKSENKW